MNIKTCKFIVTGKPIGKGRPRFVRKTGIAYTDPKTKEYEGRVKAAAWAAMKADRLMPTSSRCSIKMTAYMEIPKSYPEKKKIMCQLGAIIPPRPDIDNIIKAVCDGGNKIIYLDDAQVWHISAYKQYCKDGEKPHLDVTVQWDEGSE